MFKPSRTKQFLVRKNSKTHSINVPLPSEMYALAEQIAGATGVSLSDLCQQIVRHGMLNLPFHEADKSEAHNLTFWVTEEYYQELKAHADNQDTLFKPMLFYWFIACLKDAAHAVPRTRRVKAADKGVG